MKIMERLVLKISFFHDIWKNYVLYLYFDWEKLYYVYLFFHLLYPKTIFLVPAFCEKTLELTALILSLKRIKEIFKSGIQSLSMLNSRERKKTKIPSAFILVQLFFFFQKKCKQVLCFFYLEILDINNCSPSIPDVLLGDNVN